MANFHFSPRTNRAGEIRWREWGEAAFAEAKAANKPVLLGISAVWCHWCHVMDETSYSDAEVIRLANEHYIPIRVDNDERPDVNRRYNMGGWPTTAFLMPDGEPIHGGTYIPPDQMRHLLGEVAKLWTEQRDELLSRAAALRAKEAEARSPEPGDLSSEIVDKVGSLVRGQYDPQFGGFGRQPKFPQPRLLRFLLDEFRRHRYPDVAAMLHTTLGAMAGGGMYDHIEGGFFRYSTDREWRVPHFEKMLEDNSELLALYAEAHRTFPESGYDRVVRDVMRWMDAVLWRETVPGQGAFAGSQDADEHYFALDATKRATHDAPFVDRRIYTSWNALAVSGYLAAARALGEVAPRERAIAVLRLLLEHMGGSNGPLRHYDRGEGPALSDLLTDHAALLTALLDAHEADAFPGGLDSALALAERIEAQLGDFAGAWWDSPLREAPGRLSKREKPIEDGATMAAAFLRLAALSGDERWRTRARAGLRAFTNEYAQWGQFAAAYAAVVARALGEPVSVTVVGSGSEAEALWSVAAAGDEFVIRQRLDPARDAARIAALGYPPERVAAYVCVGTTCSAPLVTADELRTQLNLRTFSG